MQFGLDVAQHWLDWPEILRRVRYAEDSGFRGAWVFDHFKPNYPDPTTGSWNGPCLEGWTLLAALAASTERIRLGVLVTGVTYRLPSILATQAVTVDHVSNGRLEFGIGAAWFEAENRQLGVPFPPRKERFERLEEAVQAIKLLMTKDGATFGGRYYRLEDATYLPRPIQQPHPPIWIGASGEAVAIPIAARNADVWHGFGSVEALRRKAGLLDLHAERAGRDPAAILRATDLSISERWPEVRDRAEALHAAGFSYLIVSWPTEGWDRLSEFVESVMPDLPA